MKQLDKPAFAAPLEVQFPLAAGGEADPAAELVTVSSCTVGQLAQMLALLSPMLHELAALPPALLQRLASDEGPTAGDVITLLMLLAEHGDLAMRLVAVAQGWPADKVTALRPDQFAYLFAVVLQVNADFFDRAMPALRAAAGMLGALKPAPQSSTTGPAAAVS